MQTDEILKGGNAFALSFSIAYTFIYLAVIYPHFSSNNELNSTIGSAQSEVRALQAQLYGRLQRIGNELGESGSSPDHLATAASESPSLRAFVSDSQLRDSRHVGRRDNLPRAAMQGRTLVQSRRTRLSQKDLDRLSSEAADIRSRIVKNQLDYLTLENSKIKKFTIPGFAGTLDEDIVLALFPLITLLSLIWIGVYRRTLLRELPRHAGGNPPLWAAPLPFGAYKISFWRWTATNASGMSLTGVILFLVVDFLQEYRRNSFKEGYFEIYIAAISAYVVYYLGLVISAVLRRDRVALTSWDAELF